MITFQLLGPVCVKLPSGDRFPVPTPQVRALLVALLRQSSTYVPFDRLAEHIWTDPPSSARANLRTHAAALRKVLNICEAGFGRRIETSRGGAGGISAYRLLVDPTQVDAATFTSLADRGQAELLAGQLSAAVQTLTAALDLWHGPIGVDLPNTLPLQAWANSLTERRLAVIEDLAEARLQLGDYTGLVAELRHQATENPLRERLIELLMRGLHVTGDRPAAIAAYQDYRHRLAEELGIEPCPPATDAPRLAKRRADQTNPVHISTGAAGYGRSRPRIDHFGQLRDCFGVEPILR